MKYFHRFLCCLLYKTSLQQRINGWGNKLVKFQVGNLIAFNARTTLFRMSQGLGITFSVITTFHHSATVQFYKCVLFFASVFLKFLVHYPYNSLMILFCCLSPRLAFREQGSQPSLRIFVTPGSCRDSQIRASSDELSLSSDRKH